MNRSALIILLFTCAAAGETRWIRMKSPRFEVLSASGERSTRETVRHFERVRSFFINATNSKDTPLPITVVQFDSQKEYEPYQPTEFTAAFYQPGAERDYIVLGPRASDTLQVAVHEYVHLLVRHSNMELPIWLNEGLAELYSTLRPLGDKVIVGAPLLGRLQALQTRKWTPLATILSAGRDSPYYNEKAKAGDLYNQGWALAHMLFLHEGYRAEFAKVVALIVSGSTSEDALLKIYGKSLNQIERDMQGYVRNWPGQGALFPVKLEGDREEGRAEPADEYNVKLVLAEVRGRPGKYDDSRKILAELIAAEPKRSEAHAALGYLAWRDKGSGEAKIHFAKAFELGNRSTKLLWDYGRMVHRDDPAQAVKVLRMLADLQPDRFEVLMELATAHVGAKQPGMALAALAPVKKVAPADAPRLFRLVAYARMQMNDREESLKAAKRWLDSTRDDAERKQAEQMITYLERPASTRPQIAFSDDDDRPRLARLAAELPPPGSEDLPPQRPEFAGVFVELICEGENARVVVEGAGQRKSFLIADPEKIVVAGAEGGKVDLSCGPQPRTPVKVEYDPGGAGVEGIVRILDFRQ